MSYIIAILVIGSLIFFHELGHFLVAKQTKMPVKEFALGFGPSIFKFQKGETCYKLNLFPLGGYVSIDGEKDSSVKNGFLDQPWYNRLFVLAAGIVFNFIFAIVLFIVLFTFWGVPENGVEITHVESVAPASNYLKEGDQLVSIGSHYVNSDNYQNIPKWIQESGKTVDISIRRENELIISSIPLYYLESEDREILGISYVPKTIFIKESKLTLETIFVKPIQQMVSTSKIILGGLDDLVDGNVSMEDMTGPVGIVKYTSDIAKNSIGLTLYWTAMLSINLGIMNALPIPALDGGQILFLFLEKILKKRWDKKIAAVLNVTFLFLLLGFSAWITFYDILKFIF